MSSVVPEPGTAFKAPVRHMQRRNGSDPYRTEGVAVPGLLWAARWFGSLAHRIALTVTGDPR